MDSVINSLFPIATDNAADEKKWQIKTLNKIVRDALYGDLFVGILAIRRKKNFLRLKNME